MSCKYDRLALYRFGKLYAELDLDEQIEIIDLFNGRNE